ncbi:hypothetical protein M885DRAFT_615361 [Pelagophyceae sp. CCMP2097]|nr:hypothetical protein M885DRAFT_615361 [Pelagophyceae sp. CCMP2097]
MLTILEEHARVSCGRRSEPKRNLAWSPGAEQAARNQLLLTLRAQRLQEARALARVREKAVLESYRAREAEHASLRDRCAAHAGRDAAERAAAAAAEQLEQKAREFGAAHRLADAEAHHQAERLQFARDAACVRRQVAKARCTAAQVVQDEARDRLVAAPKRDADRVLETKRGVGFDGRTSARNFRDRADEAASRAAPPESPERAQHRYADARGAAAAASAALAAAERISVRAGACEAAVAAAAAAAERVRAGALSTTAAARRARLRSNDASRRIVLERQAREAQAELDLHARQAATIARSAAPKRVAEAMHKAAAERARRHVFSTTSFYLDVAASGRLPREAKSSREENSAVAAAQAIVDAAAEAAYRAATAPRRKVGQLFLDEPSLADTLRVAPPPRPPAAPPADVRPPAPPPISLPRPTVYPAAAPVAAAPAAVDTDDAASADASAANVSAYDAAETRRHALDAFARSAQPEAARPSTTPPSRPPTALDGASSFRAPSTDGSVRLDEDDCLDEDDDEEAVVAAATRFIFDEDAANEDVGSSAASSLAGRAASSLGEQPTECAAADELDDDEADGDADQFVVEAARRRAYAKRAAAPRRVVMPRSRDGPVVREEPPKENPQKGLDETYDADADTQAARCSGSFADNTIQGSLGDDVDDVEDDADDDADDVDDGAHDGDDDVDTEALPTDREASPKAYSDETDAEWETAAGRRSPGTTVTLDDAERDDDARFEAELAAAAAAARAYYDDDGSDASLHPGSLAARAVDVDSLAIRAAVEAAAAAREDEAAREAAAREEEAARDTAARRTAADAPRRPAAHDAALDAAEHAAADDDEDASASPRSAVAAPEAPLRFSAAAMRDQAERAQAVLDRARYGRQASTDDDESLAEIGAPPRPRPASPTSSGTASTSSSPSSAEHRRERNARLGPSRRAFIHSPSSSIVDSDSESDDEDRTGGTVMGPTVELPPRNEATPPSSSSSSSGQDLLDRLQQLEDDAAAANSLGREDAFDDDAAFDETDDDDDAWARSPLQVMRERSGRSGTLQSSNSGSAALSAADRLLSLAGRSRSDGTTAASESSESNSGSATSGARRLLAYVSGLGGSDLGGSEAGDDSSTDSHATEGLDDALRRLDALTASMRARSIRFEPRADLLVEQQNELRDYLANARFREDDDASDGLSVSSSSNDADELSALRYSLGADAPRHGADSRRAADSYSVSSSVDTLLGGDGGALRPVDEGSVYDDDYGAYDTEDGDDVLSQSTDTDANILADVLRGLHGNLR